MTARHRRPTPSLAERAYYTAAGGTLGAAVLGFLAGVAYIAADQIGRAL